MARRTKEQKQAVNSCHPYKNLEDTPLWRAVSRAVAKLVKNDDIEEKTARQYIVGYLAKTLADDGFEQVAELRTGQRVMHVVEVKSNGAAHQRRSVA
jgi:hypothetical protein